MPKEPAEVTSKKQELRELTGAFCDRYLTAEYKRLCHKVVTDIGRFRPVPFLSGRIENWAAGIVHAVATHNFLLSKQSDPHIRVHDITAFFGTKQVTTSQKSKQIRENLEMSPLNLTYSSRNIRERIEPLLESMMELEGLSGGGPITVFGEQMNLSPPRGEPTPGGPGEFIDDLRPTDDYYNLCEMMNGLGPAPPVGKLARRLIREDPDHLDPYLILRQVLRETDREREAAEVLDEAYGRAVRMITDDQGRWPDVLEWGWLENRHIIRTLLNKALDHWDKGETDPALEILRRLLRMNPGDNIGARDYILAIRMGMGFREYEETFASDGPFGGYDGIKMMNWFDENIDRFPDEFGWWKEAVSALEGEADDEEDDET